MEAVAQLVCERDNISEHAAEVGQNSKLARAEGRLAIGSPHLALAGIYVYPALSKGAICGIRKFSVE